LDPVFQLVQRKNKMLIALGQDEEKNQVLLLFTAPGKFTQNDRIVWRYLPNKKRIVCNFLLMLSQKHRRKISCRKEG